jgi:protocatechuate 3,4-dioxygenase beta subunit
MQYRVLSYLFYLMLLVSATSASAVGSLSGTVRERDSNDVLQGIQVQLYRSNDPNYAGDNAYIFVTSVLTDANGDYIFTDLEARQYRIHVPIGSEDSSGTRYYLRNLYHVQVFDDAETINMNLVLREVGYIWGYVYSVTGDPVSGATVYSNFDMSEDGGGQKSSVSTDVNGRYELLLLPSPGEFYALRAYHPLGVIQYSPGLYQAAVQGVRGPDFTLTESGCIQGRVVNEAGIGLGNVEIDPVVAGIDDPDALTDPSGYYTLSSLPATDMAYAMIDTDHGDSWPVLNGVRYASGERFIGPMTVTPGATCTQAPDIVMLEAGRITGVVTDAAGTPIVGVEVFLSGFDIDGFELETGADNTDALGQYALDFIPPGEYTLSANKDNWIIAIRNNVVVTSGERTDIDLVMHSSAQGADLSGTVIDFELNTCRKDSQNVLYPSYIDNVCNTDVVAFPSNFILREQEKIHPFGISTVSAGYEDYFVQSPNEIPGEYKMMLPPGDAYGALSSGFGTDRGWYVIIHDHLRWNLAAGEVLNDQDFRLPPSTDDGVLEGVINYPANTRFYPQMTRILAFNEDAPSDFVLGDAIAFPSILPAYLIERLPAGRYTLRVYSKGFVNQTYQGVVVTSGGVTVQDIDLTSGASLEGMINDAGTGLALEGVRVELSGSGKSGLSDAAGGYAISGLSPNDYDLIATKPGYAQFNGRVSVSEPATDYNITLDSTVGSITGRVQDGYAAPVNDAQVVAYNPVLNNYKTGNTIGGDFTISDLTPGDYVLGIHAPGYSTVQYPANGTLALSPNQSMTLSDPIVVNPALPLFDSASTVSESAGIKSLSITITSDQDLLFLPVVTTRGSNTGTGCSTFNWNPVTTDKLTASCEVASGEHLVWIDITEGDVPVIPGNPASASFSFEVATDLLETATTNFFNASGAESSIMGAQDKTNVYIPPFALAGADTQAVRLVVQRYGNPGDSVANNDNQSVSAVYDFSFEEDGVQIDVNHVATITLEFEKPQGMSEEEFEADLMIGYFRVSDQQWIYHTNPESGISNLRINWLNSTVTFDASHFTRFAAFLATEPDNPGDFDGDGDVDRNDLSILLQDRNRTVEASNCGSACDLDGDGMITALDARKLFLLCTRTRCAIE